MDALTTSVVSASVSVLVSVIAAILGPALASLRTRRDLIHDHFDAAQSAILIVQAARHIPHSWPASLPGGTAKQQAEYSVRTAQTGVDRFLSHTMEAKTALARIAVHVPEVNAWIRQDWELPDEDAEFMLATIETRRAKAVKSERLFRPRKISTLPRALEQH